MPLTAQQLVTLSRWLDECLELDTSQRATWLARLPPHEPELAQTLREMLAQRDAMPKGAFLAAMPALSEGAIASPELDIARAGERIGAYRLIREIGHGGMGSVWLAERADGAYKRQVALKLPRLAWGAGLAARMAREREIGAMLEHPNIARLYDAGVDDIGRPFIAMEFIEGKAIDVYCRDRQLSMRERLILLVQVARAVAYAHARLVVHRDLKPSNVLATEDGRIHLLDFGIAKLLDDESESGSALTQEQGRPLTPRYAAPEQIRGEPVTVQTDVYGLGLLAYEVLATATPYAPTGSKPLTSGQLESAILQGDRLPASHQVRDIAQRRQLRGDLDAVLGKAVKLEPRDRYRSADALADDWQNWLENKPVSALPDAVVYRLKKAALRHWVGLTATGVVCVAIASGTGISLLQAQRASEAAERSKRVQAFVTDLFGAASKRMSHSGPTRSLTTSEFLQLSAEKVQAGFADQPELQAELYGVVGRTFFNMGAYALASEYSLLRVSALRSANADKRQLAAALIHASIASLSREQLFEAEALIQEALELGRSDTALHLEANVVLGRIAADSYQNVQLAQQVERLEALVAQMTDASPIAMAWIVALKARHAARQNRFDVALSLMKTAIERAVQAEGPDSVTAAEFGVLAAVIDPDEAAGNRHFEQAMARLRRQGPDHQVRAAVHDYRFAATAFGNRWEGSSASSALAIFQRSRKTITESTRRLPQEDMAKMDLYEGSVHEAWGNVEEALTLLRRSVPTLFEGLEAKFDRYFAAMSLSSALMHAGWHDESTLWSDRAIKFAPWPKDHPWNHGIYVHPSLNLGMAGRVEDGIHLLDQAPTYPAATDGAPANFYNLRIQLTRQQLEIMRGDFSTALARFPRATLLPDAEPTMRMEAEAMIGEIECESGRLRSGLNHLKRSLRQRMQRDYEHAPWLARQRAIAGLCSLRLGQVAEARKLAQQSRVSIDGQVRVSRYYSEPVSRLESALGTRSSRQHDR